MRSDPSVGWNATNWRLVCLRQRRCGSRRRAASDRDVRRPLSLWPQNPLIYRLAGANDVLVLVQYALALPVAVALHQHNRTTGPRLSGAATAVGLSSMTAIVVLQAALLADVLEFED
jgi:hypothetical protein